MDEDLFIDHIDTEWCFRAKSYAFSRQELLGPYFIDIAAMFFAMPQALYPALAMVYGEKYVGFFPAAIASGALLASVTSGWTKNMHRHGAMVGGAAALWGVAIVFFGLSNSLVPALLFLGAAGFFDMISGIFRGSIWNQTIPNYLRGRLASIEMISYLTGPMLGSAKMGIVAEHLRVKAALVLGGVLCVIAVGGAAAFLPRFLKYDGREGVKQREREEAERDEFNKLQFVDIIPLTEVPWVLSAERMAEEHAEPASPATGTPAPPLPPGE